MVDRSHRWLDGDAGPLVRPYTLTGGRVRPSAGLNLVAYVVATGAEPDPTRYRTPEHRRILAMAAAPTSVVELAARLDLALSVVRIMLGDLVDDGLISVHEPAGDADDTATLEAVIHVLREL
ncbi:DUF742 domain-containing protein [Virgisporangium ochraceum]|uniref:DUF742 domain-containing protein n=1 Tax=Virgisporangium ochraceum TaxID=65505 RepID=A0A8J4EDX4_9ACTN|nr:DUF742 domain-containing protein [Virgisporangium ochraceum]GIJ71038.1 hypothetical protein Voc01_059550 [Virgisporangium ochraceum]